MAVRPQFDTPEWREHVLFTAIKSFAGDPEARLEIDRIHAEMDAHGVPSGREILETLKAKLEASKP